MYRKIGLFALMLILAATVVFAQGTKESDKGETIVLRMGDNIPDRSTGWGAVIERINKDFIEMHPEVKITTESYQDQAWQEKVKIYATANQLPDVMKYWSFSTLLQPLVDGKFVEPLDMDTFKQYGYMAGALEGNVYDGQLYGIPVSADLWVIYVNKALFEKAGIAYTVPEDIHLEQWNKFMLNTTYNTISSLLGATYADMDQDQIWKLAQQVSKEVQAVARRENVILPDELIDKNHAIIISLGYEGKTSMCQDLEAKRPTENPWFCKTVIRLGIKHQISTPTCEILSALVEAKEHMNLRLASIR
ncbi:MAG: extracellular solute-binding protein [Spirochaetia bacterium]|nr:extracellular solute-binding protein [Spirochaetia bacterium]